jgi:hypothetical protein
MHRKGEDMAGLLARVLLGALGWRRRQKGETKPKKHNKEEGTEEKKQTNGVPKPGESRLSQAVAENLPEGMTSW